MLTTAEAAHSGSPLLSVDFSATDRVVVAVSGGSDSTALLLLARDHFHPRNALDRIVAVTVDHRLRAEAADEAAAVSRLCASLGLSHRTMRWEGGRPSSGIQEAARRARYRLLAEAAADAGAAIVLTGHTMDDQAETLAMRMDRGTGRGLSGIPPATLYERKVWFVRPLLGRTRADLRTFLEGHGQSWIDDPSNADPSYERVRTRQTLGAGARDDAASKAVTAYASREAAARAAAAVIASPQIWAFDAKAAVADLMPDRAQDDGASALSLSAVMAWVGRRDHLPSADRVEAAWRFCREAASRERLTVSGCLLEKHANRVTIRREARNRRPPGFAFDHLVPSPDYPMASALALRTGLPPGPPPPVSGYPD